ncbi:hypothetical protein ACFTSF_21365 [Kribbella sp. NPDC056951]|uniref:hypothetical protein n=1 Tax=Kribbella sp. NPDC056951 TaxID=3345978 RepID=UPI003641F2C0
MRERVENLYRQGRRHEMAGEVEPARRYLEEALASAAGLDEMVLRIRSILGVVSHKEGNLAETRLHLEVALELALARADLMAEAYVRQELGFLLLGEGRPEESRSEFLRALALAPAVGIVNLTGNGLSGLGVAALAVDRAADAVPLLLGALGIRTEIDDFEQQHVDLVHLARAASQLGQHEIAAGVAGFLVRSPETSKGMYAHDRRAFDALVATVPTHSAITSFAEARSAVAALVSP